MGKKTSTRKPKAICSFCGKSANQADTLIEGPNKVFICPECVELCHNIIRQDRKRAGKSTIGLEGMPRPREILLGMFLPYHVLVQIFFYCFWFGHFFKTYAAYPGTLAILLDDVVTQLNAFRANIDIVRAFYECIGLSSGSAAETADCLGFFSIWLLGHFSASQSRIKSYCIPVLDIVSHGGYLCKFLQKPMVL